MEGGGEGRGGEGRGGEGRGEGRGGGGIIIIMQDYSDDLRCGADEFMVLQSSQNW